jgi:hypothetical protein
MKTAKPWQRAAVAMGAVAGAGVLVGSATAQAATVNGPAREPITAARTVTPFAASGCSINMCMYLSTQASGTVYVSGWVETSGFTGTFQLTGPDGLNLTSPSEYRAPGVGWRWNNVPAVVGRYCITGYSIYSGGQGEVCENIE